MDILGAAWEGLGDVARDTGKFGGELGKGVDEFLEPGVRASAEGIKDITGIDLSGKSDKSWYEQGKGMFGLEGIIGDIAKSFGVDPKILLIAGVVVGGAVLLIMVMK